MSQLWSLAHSVQIQTCTYLARQPGHVVMPSPEPSSSVLGFFNTSCSVTERTIISSLSDWHIMSAEVMKHEQQQVHLQAQSVLIGVMDEA